MSGLKKFLFGSILLGISAVSYAGSEMGKQLAVDFDTVAPASSMKYSAEGKPTSMWGAAADFNLNHFVTGPEIWIGNFSRKGPSADDSERVRREDMQSGESQKLNAMRLKWTVSWFEVPENMRGWFLKAGYAYTRINSRAKRYVDDNNTYGLAISTTESNISDIRHGATIGFGQRWTFFNHNASVTLGASYTPTLKRVVNVDSADPDARSDYDSTIENIQDTHMSARGMPEANLGVGFLL